MEDTKRLGQYILGKAEPEDFDREFGSRCSKGFNPSTDLRRIGVVNQTTMLATETQAIADFLRQTMVEKYGAAEIKNHFADTRDTLCYATNDNQDATYELLKTEADLAVVVGGYNSSNTSHIVELCEKKFPTYFINSENEIKSKNEIHHFDYDRKQKITTFDFLPDKPVVKIVLTSGASCPDTIVDRVMLRIMQFFEGSRSVKDVLVDFEL